MISSVWIAAILALFLWWFSTGAILLVVRKSDQAEGRAHGASVLWSLPFLAIGCVGVWLSLSDASVLGAYYGFVSTLLIWGWIELAFLSGVITGPNRLAFPKGAPEWERFVRAWGTIAYHEMLLAAAFLTLIMLSFNAENSFAVLTFGLLFAARISAKLNLFLGVPRINTEFLPIPLAHLPSHFRHATMNWLFPFSVTILAFATACWMERIYSADTQAQAVGFALLTSMTALALLEHWLMVVPLPDAKLWRWMLPAPTSDVPKT